MPVVTRSMSPANRPPSVHRTNSSAALDETDCRPKVERRAHPAETPIKDGTSYLLDRLSAENRLNIYRLLWDKSDGTQRRMHWKGGIIPDFDNPWADAPRKMLDDTAILSVCKFNYDEAQPELIATSTLIVEIDDVEELQQFPNILNNVRYLEIRDSKHSGGYQIFYPREYGDAFTSDEKEEQRQVTVSQLQNIKALLNRTPLLKTVTIGFEILHVQLDGEFAWLSDDPPETMTQVYATFAMSGLGELSCTGIGTWRVEESTSPVVEVKHFTVVSQFNKCTTTSCDCGGDENKWEDMCLEASMSGQQLLADAMWLRHRLAQVGFLGPEAQAACGDAVDIAEGNELSDLAKTWYILINAWP